MCRFVTLLTGRTVHLSYTLIVSGIGSACCNPRLLGWEDRESAVGSKQPAEVPHYIWGSTRGNVYT